MYMFFFGSINQFVHEKFLNMASMWVYENKDRMSKMQHKGKYNIYFFKGFIIYSKGKAWLEDISLFGRILAD